MIIAKRNQSHIRRLASGSILVGDSGPNGVTLPPADFFFDSTPAGALIGPVGEVYTYTVVRGSKAQNYALAMIDFPQQRAFWACRRQLRPAADRRPGHRGRGAGGTQRPLRTISRSDAMFLLLTGERIDASEALRIGLVSKVVEPGELMSYAVGVARRIAENAPLSVVAVKQLVDIGGELPLSASLGLEQQVYGLLQDTADRIEGRRTFAAKEKPRFTGR